VGKIYSGKITLFWAKDDEADFEDNRLDGDDWLRAGWRVP